MAIFGIPPFAHSSNPEFRPVFAIKSESRVSKTETVEPEKPNIREPPINFIFFPLRLRYGEERYHGCRFLL